VPFSFHTIAVSAGRDPASGAMLNPSIALGSNFRLTSETDYLPNYSRNDGTATWQAFEVALGALEGGQAVAFASGMAAVSAVLEALPTGAVVVAPRIAYVGLRQQLAERADRGRLEARFVDTTDTESTLAALPGATLLWLETPANPTIDVCDLPALLGAARGHGITSVVDSTFATPVLQRPLALGADIVVHSVTKFIGGHSDLLMGAVVTAPDRAAAVAATRGLYGAVPGAIEAFLALRGLRTLPLRMERAQATAQLLAERLAAHPAVERVRYPGLATDPGHARAMAQMDGFGAMVAFDLADGEAADRACHAAELIVHATSLGGVETTMERRNKYPSEQGVPPGLIRLSVGIEDPEDLWADLLGSLAAAAG
jgi:cystathionine gamma-synthase